MRMFLDTNILVHAYNKSSPMREKASALLMSALRNEVRVVVSPQVLFEFYSVITNPRHVEKPLRPDEAAGICLDLLASFHIEKVCSTTSTAREAFSLASIEPRAPGRNWLVRTPYPRAPA